MSPSHDFEEKRPLKFVVRQLQRHMTDWTSKLGAHAAKYTQKNWGTLLFCSQRGNKTSIPTDNTVQEDNKILFMSEELQPV